MMLSEQFRTLAMFSMLKDPIPATESGLTMQLKSYKMNNLSLDDLPVNSFHDDTPAPFYKVVDI